MKKNRGFTLLELGIVLMLVIIITIILTFVSGIAIEFGEHLDREAYFATVTEKAVKRVDDTDKYLISTKLLTTGEVRVFENTDSVIEGKRNSSDLNAKIEVGKSYRFRTYGWRWQFFSRYENILAVEEVRPEDLPRVEARN